MLLLIHFFLLYLVAEDASVGAALIPLETTDADAESKPLDFFIIDGDDNCNFNVNSSGIVYISRTLNREYIDKYILTVLATDGKFSALSKISVDVLDVNGKFIFFITPPLLFKYC